MSLRAPIIGRRGRGRIYLPCFNKSTCDTTGVANSTRTDALRAGVVTLIGNLQNMPGWTTYQPLVAIMSAGSATAVRPVEVRTGNRLDTIRSRRAQVPEVYTATAL